MAAGATDIGALKRISSGAMLLSDVVLKSAGGHGRT
jgi:hypothetical protein